MVKKQFFISSVIRQHIVNDHINPFTILNIKPIKILVLIEKLISFNHFASHLPKPSQKNQILNILNKNQRTPINPNLWFRWQSSKMIHFRLLSKKNTSVNLTQGFFFLFNSIFL